MVQGFFRRARSARLLLLILCAHFFVLIFSLTLTGQAQAATSAKVRGMTASYDYLFRDSDSDLIELRGNVQLIKADEHITCDRAVIHMRSQQVELYGHVFVVSTSSTISGEYVLLDYETQTGVIYGGFVQSGQVYFEGKMIQKTGPNEFMAMDSEYTSCTDCPATWSFQGTRVRAELGGYAYIKNAVMRVADFPVLWLPYLVVPLKSDRQSGLLTPTFEQSDNGGLTFAESYFWAIDRSTDATFTLKNYEHRGLKTLFDYRYVLDEDSAGELDVSYLGDRFFAQSNRLNDYQVSKSAGGDLGDIIPRWYVKYVHRYELPDDMTQRIQINHASDLAYPQDFPLETGNHGDPAMEDRVSLSQNIGSDYYWHIDSSYYTNMLRRNPLASNDDAVHRMPEIQFSQLQKNIGDSKFVYNWDFVYTNFTRNMQGWDDLSGPFQSPFTTNPVRYVTNNQSSNGNPIIKHPELCDDAPQTQDSTYSECHRIYDGKFNPGQDLIRTGQRIEFSPTVSYPIEYSGFEFIPQVEYHELQYDFNVDNASHAYRRLVRGQLYSAFNFSHIYGDPGKPGESLLKHEIIPQVTYQRAPWVDQSNSPFFGFGETQAPVTPSDAVTDGDLGSNMGLQFDYNDRLFNTNIVTFGLLNRWTQKRWIAGVPQYRQIVSWQLNESYDAYLDSLHDATRPPWSQITSVLSVSLDEFYGNSSVAYYPYQNVYNSTSRVEYHGPRGEYGLLGLSEQYRIVPGQDVDPNSYTEDYTGGIGLITRYLNLMGKLVYDANWVGNKRDTPIKSYAYITQLKPPGECWMITFIYDQITGGETNYRIGFDFNFDGSPLKPLPYSTLDQFGF